MKDQCGTLTKARAADRCRAKRIVQHGVHPHLGPDKGDMSRGQRETVLGNEIGADDAYTRGLMRSLQAALNTKRSMKDEWEEPCSRKQRTDGGEDKI